MADNFLDTVDSFFKGLGNRVHVSEDLKTALDFVMPQKANIPDFETDAEALEWYEGEGADEVGNFMMQFIPEGAILRKEAKMQLGKIFAEAIIDARAEVDRMVKMKGSVHADEPIYWVEKRIEANIKKMTRALDATPQKELDRITAIKKETNPDNLGSFGPKNKDVWLDPAGHKIDETWFHEMAHARQYDNLDGLGYDEFAETTELFKIRGELEDAYKRKGLDPWGDFETHKLYWQASPIEDVARRFEGPMGQVLEVSETIAHDVYDKTYRDALEKVISSHRDMKKALGPRWADYFVPEGHMPD